eukprot:gene7391-15089_t
MGGYPSSKIRKTAEMTVSVADEQHSCCSALDQCILLIFQNVSQEQAVRSLFRNRIGMEMFVEFLMSTVMDKIDAILKHDEMGLRSFDDTKLILQKAVKACTHVSEYMDKNEGSLDKAIYIVICEAFPGYLKSSFYRASRLTERIEAIDALVHCNILEATLPELTSRNKNYNIAEAYMPNQPIDVKSINEDSYISQQRRSCDYVPDKLVVASDVSGENILEAPKTIIEEAFEHCDPIEVSKLLRSRSWLPIFLAMTETLPIGISLSRVQLDNNKFPVVYMNKYLENELGFKRKSCIDHNLDFFRFSSLNNVDEINHLVNKRKQSVVTVLNRSSNEEYSHSIVGIKPIFDDHSIDRYVLGFHFNRKNANCEVRQRCWSFLGELLDTLPDFHRFDELLS